MAKSRTEEIADSLRSRIKAGEWPAGSTLPNERTLAEEYSVARNTLRKAFDVIEFEGLVDRHVGRGTIVKQQVSHELIEIVDRISGTSPLDIIMMRLFLEPEAAAAAATNSSVSDIRAISEAYEKGLTAISREEFEFWDIEFHRRIFVGTRNEFLINLHDILLIIRGFEPMIEMRKRHYHDDIKQAYCEQHKAILDALMLRHADGASEAMRAHLNSRREDLFGRAGS
jgi:DNA-binding FadR family transcriptional regulator